MPGIGVVLNPYARSNQRDPRRVERLAKLVGDDGVVEQTNGIDVLGDVARRFRDQGVDLLAICGGDGTIFRTLTAFRAVWGERELPLVVPLRGGTINVIASSIHAMRGGPERVLAHVVHDYRRGGTHDVVERELLTVNGEQHGFLFGLGLIVNFLRVYYTSPNPTPLRAAGLLAKFAGSAVLGTSLIRGATQPVVADVDCDGEKLPFRIFRLMLGMTIEHLPLGFRPGYLATRKHGHFHLLGGPIAATRVVRHLGKFRKGIPVHDPELYDNLARVVRIEFERPTHYMIDADILGPVESLTLTAGPRVRLVRG